MYNNKDSIVQDQHASVIVCITTCSLLKQQCGVRHIATLGHIIMIIIHTVFVILAQQRNSKH